MEDTIRRVEEFMRMYERNCTMEDAVPLVAQFTDPFQFAGQEGTKVIGREVFAALLPKRKSMFAQMGCGEGQLVSIETNMLDARYIVARTRWKIPIRSGEVMIDTSFLIQDVDGDLKIILYLPHDDLQSILEREGAVPAHV